MHNLFLANNSKTAYRKHPSKYNYHIERIGIRPYSMTFLEFIGVSYLSICRSIYIYLSISTGLYMHLSTALYTYFSIYEAMRVSMEQYITMNSSGH